MSIPSITYDRTDRNYVVTMQTEDGPKSAKFPNGKEGKQAAEIFAVGIHSPLLGARLQQIVAKWPVLKSRAIKGAYMTANEDLWQEPTGEYCVLSQTNAADYHVIEVKDNVPSCTCADFQIAIGNTEFANNNYGGAPTVNGSPMCKHILALMFMYNLGIEIQADTKRHDLDNLKEQLDQKELVAA